jgi:D-methionine transport system substrate-binding protein
MHIFKWILTACLAIFLIACSEKSEDENHSNANTIRVGVIVDGDQKLMQVVQKAAAKKYDLRVKLIPYAELKDLNKALQHKEIDANILQHHIYFQYSEQKYGYQFSELGVTYLYPMGVYSRNITNILQLPKRAIIAIPEEPTNEARALFLLEKAGLIRMAADDDTTATIRDIVSNPKELQFLKFPAKKVVKLLPKVDAAVINVTYILPAGLNPAKDALVIENKDSEYASVVVVRRGEERDLRLKALLEILRSTEVQKVVEKIFHGQAIPAWK